MSTSSSENSFSSDTEPYSCYDAGAWEFRDSHIHGTGMFAKKDIAKGTQILFEAALWVIPKDVLLNVYPFLNLSGIGLRSWCIRQLSSDSGEIDVFVREQVIEQLCGGAIGMFKEDRKDTERRLHEVIIRNAKTDVNEGKQLDYAYLYEHTSRINHSCMLCAELTLVPNQDNFGGHFAQVIAARDIKANEEITINYTGWFATSSERQELLRENHGFICACALCSQGKKRIASTDTKRKQARAIVAKLEDAWSQVFDAGEKTIRVRNKLIKVSDQIVAAHVDEVLRLVKDFMDKKLDEVCDYAYYESLFIGMEFAYRAGRPKEQLTCVNAITPIALAYRKKDMEGALRGLLNYRHQDARLKMAPRWLREFGRGLSA